MVKLELPSAPSPIIRWRVAAGAALALILIATAFREYGRRVYRGAETCRHNLIMIDIAKEQFALEHNKKIGEAVTWDDLIKPGAEGYLKKMPKGEIWETYSINAIGRDPTCSSNALGHDLGLVDRGVITATE